MKSKKIKKLSVPPTSLQNDLTSSKVFPAEPKFGQFLTTGKWTKTNPEKDKKIEDLATFINSPPKPFNDAKKQIVVDAKKYLNLKDEIARRRKEQNKKTLMYTLIDPKNRETERLANSMFPELIKTNDEFFLRNLELQKSLYRMIQRGTFETRQELEEFYYMLTNPDFFLPLGPSWDPNKTIFQRNLFTLLSTPRQNTIGIWNPKKIFNTYRDFDGESTLYATNVKESLNAFENMDPETTYKKVIEQENPITNYDQIVLKVRFAARVCPMFADADPNTYRGFDKVLSVIKPILLGEDGLDVDIFETTPDTPSRVSNENVVVKEENSDI